MLVKVQFTVSPGPTSRVASPPDVSVPGAPPATSQLTSVRSQPSTGSSLIVTVPEKFASKIALLARALPSSPSSSRKKLSAPSSAGR